MIKDVQELVKWAEQRDRHAVDLINREVLAKNRRALLIFGDGHFPRKSIRSNYERDDLGPLITRSRPATQKIAPSEHRRRLRRPVA